MRLGTRRIIRRRDIVSPRRETIPAPLSGRNRPPTGTPPFRPCPCPCPLRIRGTLGPMPNQPASAIDGLQAAGRGISLALGDATVRRTYVGLVVALVLATVGLQALG